MIKSTISPALRPLTANAKSLLRAQPLLAGRHYATSGAESKRRSVTPFNDDGHVPWSELSGAEKTGRTAQQTFNFGMVLVGVLLTASVPRNETFSLSLPRRRLCDLTVCLAGRCWLRALLGSFLPRQQSCLLQSSG